MARKRGANARSRAGNACDNRRGRNNQERFLDIASEVVKVLDEILRLGPRAASMGRESALLGAIPELDSMAVVSILTLIEERFGIVVEDDEMDGAVFATLGSLTDFVAAKLAG
jgi:acyl carrier protein